MDKLICVGKNYLEHVLEMAKVLGDAIPEKPVLFLKPPSTVVSVKKSGDTVSVSLPRGRGTIHPECEIVLRLNSQAAIEAVTLGLDMTLRDVQTDLKKKGHPWEIAKVFRDSAVIGPWIEISHFKNYLQESFSLSLDGKTLQKARGAEMRFSPEECLSHAQESFLVCPGDVLFTGTPAGVGPVQPGQIGELRWGNHLSYRVQFE